MEYYSVIKKEYNIAICRTRMDLENIILGEVNRTKTNVIQYYLYVGSKNNTNESIYKQKQTHRHRKQTCVYQRGKERRGVKLGVWN